MTHHRDTAPFLRLVFVAHLQRERSRHRLLCQPPDPEVADNPSHTADHAYHLMKLARSYHILCENACNRDLRAPEQRRMASIELRLATLAETILHGTTVLLSGDPRGCVVKLKLPSGFTDDFAREGLCVPTH